MATNPKMILDGYTFAKNPNRTQGMFEEDKPTSYVVTYSSVDFFAWNATIVGKKVTLLWDYMPTAQYDTLHTKWLTGSQVEIDPVQDTAFKFYVHILNLQGTYFLDIEGAYRKDASLELLIMGEVPEP